MKTIVYIICIILCSCHSQSGNHIVVWQYDNFIKKDIKLSDIADEMIIIQPDSIFRIAVREFKAFLRKPRKKYCFLNERANIVCIRNMDVNLNISILFVYLQIFVRDKILKQFLVCN